MQHKLLFLVMAILLTGLAGCTSPDPGSGGSSGDYRAAPLGPSSWKPDVFGGEPISNQALRILKRGDKIIVNFSGVPSHFMGERLEYPKLINEHGSISLLYINEIQIAGMTPTRAARKIEQAYIKGGFFKTISCSVLPKDPIFFVRGEVRAPGGKIITGNMTLTRAIAMAGDFTDFAGKKITITRMVNGKRKQVEYNWKKISDGSEPDPKIYPDDVITVSGAGRLQFSPLE